MYCFKTGARIYISLGKKVDLVCFHSGQKNNVSNSPTNPSSKPPEPKLSVCNCGKKMVKK